MLRDTPDMVLIYDKDGSVAGMQSGMPASEFSGGACPDSPYYQKDTINGVEVIHTVLPCKRTNIVEKSTVNVTGETPV